MNFREIGKDYVSINGCDAVRKLITRPRGNSLIAKAARMLMIKGALKEQMRYATKKGRS